VSYFTHSPEFFELNDGVRADLGVNSRDAHDAALVLTGFEFAVLMMDAEVLWQFQVHNARCGNFVHRPFVVAAQESALRRAVQQLSALWSSPPLQPNHRAYELFTLNPGIQGLLELVGGLLLGFGLFTRPVAFILAGNMAVAYFMAHAPRGFFPLLNGGELAIVYCFVFLYLWIAGAGEWSLDRLRSPTSEPVLSPRRA